MAEFEHGWYLPAVPVNMTPNRLHREPIPLSGRPSPRPGAPMTFVFESPANGELQQIPIQAVREYIYIIGLARAGHLTPQINYHAYISEISNTNISEILSSYSRNLTNFIDQAKAAYGPEWVNYYETAGHYQYIDRLYKPEPAAQDSANPILPHRVMQIIWDIARSRENEKMLFIKEFGNDPLDYTDNIIKRKIDRFIADARHSYGSEWTRRISDSGKQNGILTLIDFVAIPKILPRVHPERYQLNINPPEKMQYRRLNSDSDSDTVIDISYIQARDILYKIGKLGGISIKSREIIADQEVANVLAYSGPIDFGQPTIRDFIMQCVEQFGLEWTVYYLAVGYHFAELGDRWESRNSGNRYIKVDTQSNINLEQIPDAPEDPIEPPLPTTLPAFKFRGKTVPIPKLRQILRTCPENVCTPRFVEELTTFFRTHNNRDTDWMFYHLMVGPNYDEIMEQGRTLTAAVAARRARELLNAASQREFEPRLRSEALLRAYKHFHPGQSTPTLPANRRRVATPTEDSPTGTAAAASCVKLFGEVRTPLGRKLKRICGVIKEECVLDRLSAIREAANLAGRSTPMRILQVPAGGESTAIWRTMVFHVFAEYDPDAKNEWADLFLGSLDDITVQYYEQVSRSRSIRNPETGEEQTVFDRFEIVPTAAIGQGTKLEFMQRLMDGMLEETFFVQAEDSHCYIPNPAMTIELLRSKGYPYGSFTPSQGYEMIMRIYKWIGRIFAFCVRMNIPTGVYLPLGLLDRLVYNTAEDPKSEENEIDPDEEIVYSLLDFPDTIPASIAMIKDPESIADWGMEYTPTGTLAEIPITKRNFRDALVAKYHHKIQPESVRFKALQSGFYIRKKLREMEEPPTVSELNAILCGSPITLQTFAKWLESDPITTTIDARLSEAQRDLRQRVFDTFMEILRSDGADFPLSLVKGDAVENTPAARKKEFVVFLGKLIAFWSGLQKLDASRKYQVAYIDNESPLTRDKMYPEAHTCYSQIVLPINIVPASRRTPMTPGSFRKELYRRLVQGVYLAEAGLGMYGGRRRRTQRPQRPPIVVRLAPVPKIARRRPSRRG